MSQSQATLDRVLLHDDSLTEDHLGAQWTRQQAMQLNAIETGTSRALYAKLERLVELEEQLRDSKYKSA